MFSQSISKVLDETIKGLGLASLLYPLERIQSIKQIQRTYSDSLIKHHSSIVALSTHSGIGSYFRGFMPFIAKLGILNLSTRLCEVSMKNHSQNKRGLQILTFGFSTLAYFITYPFEIVNIRISSELEKERFYSNTRQCMSKIKKNQGVKTLYRGFLWAYTIFTIQFSLLHYLQTQHQAYIFDMSEQQKIFAVFGAVSASQVMLYPLTSLKKMYQINGAMGHTDQYYNIRSAFRQSKIIDLWRGLQIRLGNIAIYSLLYCALFDGLKTEHQ